jgi:hypothetical protein
VSSGRRDGGALRPRAAYHRAPTTNCCAVRMRRTLTPPAATPQGQRARACRRGTRARETRVAAALCDDDAALSRPGVGGSGTARRDVSSRQLYDLDLLVTVGGAQVALLAVGDGREHGCAALAAPLRDPLRWGAAAAWYAHARSAFAGHKNQADNTWLAYMRRLGVNGAPRHSLSAPCPLAVLQKCASRTRPTRSAAALTRTTPCASWH